MLLSVCSSRLCKEHFEAAKAITATLGIPEPPSSEAPVCSCSGCNKPQYDRRCVLLIPHKHCSSLWALSCRNCKHYHLWQTSLKLLKETLNKCGLTVHSVVPLSTTPWVIYM